MTTHRLGRRAVVAIGMAVVASLLSVAFWQASADPSAKEEKETGQIGVERVVAVLVSVSKTENARMQFSDVDNLDLLELNGMPMILHVYNALRASKYVRKIIVVGAPDVEEELRLEEQPMTTFVKDRGDAAENVRYGIDEISVGDLIMFIPSDLVLVTPEGLDRLIERVLAEKEVDIFFPIVSREVCEDEFPEERRTYARFREGQYTGAHVEFVRPDLFLEHADQVKANKDNLYNIYHMRKSTLGIVRFLGLRLTLKYVFGVLSPHDVEQHILDNYRVTAKAIFWDDPDLATDLSEPRDIRMIKQALEQRELAHSGDPLTSSEFISGAGARNGV